jgi:hypothetical protein
MPRKGLAFESAKTKPRTGGAIAIESEYDNHRKSRSGGIDEYTQREITVEICQRVLGQKNRPRGRGLLTIAPFSIADILSSYQ